MAPGDILAECLEMIAGVPQNAAIRLTTLTAKLAYLRSKSGMILGPIASPQDILTLLDDATELDRQLIAWMESTPEDWQFAAARHFELPANVPKQNFVYNDRMDVYADLSVADVWNSYRVTRLKVLSIILDCIAALPEPLGQSLRKQNHFVLATLQKLADDICASVPLHLGTKTRPGTDDQPEVEYPYTTAKAGKDLRLACAGLGGWELIEPNYEPLRNALMVGSLRAGQEEWILGQLSRIGQLYALPKSSTTQPRQGKDATS